jgi:DNA-binding NarL/FixJ family response regulator
MRERMRVLLADDNALFRNGVVALLGLCEHVELAGQAAHTGEAVRRTIQLRPALLAAVRAGARGGCDDE